MTKKVIGILIAFMLVGCSSKEDNIADANLPYTEFNEETSVKSNTAEKNDEEKNDILGQEYGTIIDISESSVTIEGDDSKRYTGDPGRFKDLYKGEFVYFEFYSNEENDEGYSVEFTKIRYQDRNFNGPNDIDED